MVDINQDDNRLIELDKRVSLEEVNERIMMYFKRQGKVGDHGQMTNLEDMDEFDKIVHDIHLLNLMVEISSENLTHMEEITA